MTGRREDESSSPPLRAEVKCIVGHPVVRNPFTGSGLLVHTGGNTWTQRSQSGRNRKHQRQETEGRLLLDETSKCS